MTNIDTHLRIAKVISDAIDQDGFGEVFITLTLIVAKLTMFKSNGDSHLAAERLHTIFSEEALNVLEKDIGNVH